MKRSGVADLPLHGGRVPLWLAERITKLSSAITETMVHGYGAGICYPRAHAESRVAVALLQIER